MVSSDVSPIAFLVTLLLGRLLDGLDDYVEIVLVGASGQ